ncbi:MAG: glycoside hydrolase family 37 [Bacteroidetes bacterium]|nr:MAG: glycoside hydrolase family 37 [Bacteroidota bacterium]
MHSSSVPHTDAYDPHTLRQICEQVIESNWRDGFTVPSSNLYPFQWLWDSGFIALGWSWTDMGKARQELSTLLQAQWKNGFLPHIVFHDDRAEKQYFPGADFQGAHTHAFAPTHVKTSGITQPAVLGFVLEYLYQREENPDAHANFYIQAISRIFDFHVYLYRDRDPLKENLVYIRHNWESGTDNSAAWDSIWAGYEAPVYEVRRKDTHHVNEAQRPTKKDYNYYLHLIELSRECGYDEARMYDRLPFLVQDPLFNTLLVASGQSIARMARQFGLDDMAQQSQQWAEATSIAINQKLWVDDLSLYGYYDLRNKRMIAIRTAPGLCPLFAGIADAERAARMQALMTGPDFSGSDAANALCPSLAYTDPEFNPERYWRGPVWVNINWLLYKGCLQYGFEILAERIRQDTLNLVARYGVYEYFYPLADDRQRPGFGGTAFSWTAALVIEMIRQSEHPGSGRASIHP